MIVPSIDLEGGRTVQLVGGEDLAIDAGAPGPIAERFSVAGPIAVIDLDAAKRQGSNAHLIEPLLKRYRCRVGGGVRDEETAREWLDAGAEQVILGTAATPELLQRLPKERVMAAVDARDGEVVVQGWRSGTGADLIERIRELKDHVGSFLVTFVESEGRMQGIRMDRVKAVVEAAAPVRVVVAGGVTTAREVGEIDRLGADCQVGMALYSGRMKLADAIAAPLQSDRPDGLFSTVVVDEHGQALGLAYSSVESIRKAVEGRRGVYHSRKRGLWVKGETSGAIQSLVRIDLDCDRDALRFVVRQAPPGNCHTGTWTCWGEDDGIPRLYRRLLARMSESEEGSYTKRLFGDRDLLRSKLIEEAYELADAESPAHVAEEAADVIYFAMVSLIAKGATLADVERVLAKRELRVTRRKGDAKS